MFAPRATLKYALELAVAAACALAEMRRLMTAVGDELNAAQNADPLYLVFWEVVMSAGTADGWAVAPSCALNLTGGELVAALAVVVGEA